MVVSIPLNASAPALPKESIPEISATSTEVQFELVNAEVTMYSAIESCHYENCVMASGKRVYIGAVACPRKYVFGTEVEIDGARYTCEDRTAIRYDGRFDIFAGHLYEDYDRALKWGIRTMEIKIF